MNTIVRKPLYKTSKDLRLQQYTPHEIIVTLFRFSKLYPEVFRQESVVLPPKV